MYVVLKGVSILLPIEKKTGMNRRSNKKSVFYGDISVQTVLFGATIVPIGKIFKSKILMNLYLKFLSQNNIGFKKINGT